MLERALPLSQREIEIESGENQGPRRSSSRSARLYKRAEHDLALRLARMLRAVAAFLAAGGALS
jgi:hypothetical protein